MLSSRHDDMK